MNKKMSTNMKYLLIALLFFALGVGFTYFCKQHYCAYKKDGKVSSWWSERGVAGRGHCLEK